MICRWRATTTTSATTSASSSSIKLAVSYCFSLHLVGYLFVAINNRRSVIILLKFNIILCDGITPAAIHCTTVLVPHPSSNSTCTMFGPNHTPAKFRVCVFNGCNEILLTQRNNLTSEKYSQPLMWWSKLQDMYPEPLSGLLIHTQTHRQTG